MTVELVPWSDGDLMLLEAANTAAMTAHLGGPESDAKVRARHRRYLTMESGRMFRVALDGRPAGSIGFWPHDEVYETGWSVLPAFQGRGLAVAAARLVIDAARADGGRESLHAYPSIAHAASNAVCRRAGFALLGEVAFEYPPGNPLRCHDWAVTL